MRDPDSEANAGLLVHSQSCLADHRRTGIRYVDGVGSYRCRTRRQESFARTRNKRDGEIRILIRTTRIQNIPGRSLSNVTTRYRGRVEKYRRSIYRNRLGARGDSDGVHSRQHYRNRRRSRARRTSAGRSRNSGRARLYARRDSRSLSYRHRGRITRRPNDP